MLPGVISKTGFGLFDVVGCGEAVVAGLSPWSPAARKVRIDLEVRWPVRASSSRDATG
jgi:hypothetical protein